jgi:hypothetical protein
MSIHPLTPALARLQAARDNLVYAPVDGPAYTVSGGRLDRLSILTEGSVRNSDLQCARAMIAQFENERPDAPHVPMVAAYAHALSDVGALLRDLTGTPPPWDTSRPGLPASMRGYAIAKVGFLNHHTVERECLQHGFVKTGSTYIHDDGSWANVVLGTTVEIGWKGYSLDDLGALYDSGWQ